MPEIVMDTGRDAVLLVGGGEPVRRGRPLCCGPPVWSLRASSTARAVTLRQRRACRRWAGTPIWPVCGGLLPAVVTAPHKQAARLRRLLHEALREQGLHPGQRGASRGPQGAGCPCGRREPHLCRRLAGSGLPHRHGLRAAGRGTPEAGCRLGTMCMWVKARTWARASSWKRGPIWAGRYAWRRACGWKKNILCRTVST